MTINATMINVQADGVVSEPGTRSTESGQRVAFDSTFGNSGKGVSRELSDLFPTGPLATDNVITSMSETREKFLLNDVPANENPDFPNGVDLLYSQTADMLVHDPAGDTLPGDKPSKKGPNLLVPKINDDGSVDTSTVSETVAREETSRGFGVTVEHNTEGRLIEGRYLNRKDAEEVKIKLGEYFDVTEYNWEN